MKLYRTMIASEADGLPAVGINARMLGVRVPPNPHPDIVPDPAGNVHPSTGGMSTAPDDPLSMAPFLLPDGPRFGGTSKRGAVFEIDAAVIASPLVRNDTERSDCLIEPDRAMPLASYQTALAATRRAWRVF